MFVPQATYKCVQISRQTRADEVVKMILSSYGSDERPEKFVLVESLSDSEGKGFLKKLHVFSPFRTLALVACFLFPSCD